MAGSWTPFRSYIYSSGLMVRSGDKGREMTHLLLDGGIVSCPPDQQREFNARYAEALANKVPLFCVEKKTAPAFYMMSEFDLKLRDRAITDDELKLIVRIVQSTVVKAFANADHILAVLTAPPKDTKLKDGTPAVQSGIHFVWKIPVSIDTAWQLRAWILRELDAGASTSVVPWAESWSEMYDACVFLDNGLRMVGSNKAAKCTACDGKSFKRDKDSGSVCASCQNAGRLDLGRPYELLFVADDKGDPDASLTATYKDPSHVVELVELCSIRVMPDDPPVPISGGDEAQLAKWVVIDKAAVKKSRSQPQPRGTPGPKKESKRDDMVELIPTAPEYGLIARYVLTEFTGTPIATHIRKTEAGDLYIINSKCHWCANKNGEHSHSNVYYMLGPRGCSQKCFCAKTQANGRACLSFTSRPHPVPADVLEAIFTPAVLKTREREESRARLMQALTPRPVPYTVPSRAGTGINLPEPAPGAVDRLRRRGIEKKVDYATIAAPQFSATDFLATLKNTKFILTHL